jgi:hypothetical protein
MNALIYLLWAIIYVGIGIMIDRSFLKEPERNVSCICSKLSPTQLIATIEDK